MATDNDLAPAAHVAARKPAPHLKAGRGAEAPDYPEPGMVRMVVAAGRTVQISNGFDLTPLERKVDGQTVVEKVRVPNGEKKYAKPGEEVDLPEATAARLHELGYLKHPGEGNTRPVDRPMLDRGSAPPGRVTQGRI